MNIYVDLCRSFIFVFYELTYIVTSKMFRI